MAAGRTRNERTLRMMLMPKFQVDGWWEQSGYGRQPMTNLIIEFTNGQLDGSGDDIVGPFVLSGHIQGDQIVIHKQYLGQHTIDYHGTSDGEGVYFGDWTSCGHVGGKWSIRVRSVAKGSENVITEIRLP